MCLLMFRPLVSQPIRTSIANCLQLAASTDVHHNETGYPCIGCNIIANHYRTALRYSRQQVPIACDKLLLELVSQATQLLSDHFETRTHHTLHWFEELSSDLWEFGKELKEQSHDIESHSSSTSLTTPPLSPGEKSAVFEDPENYRRAIRIVIYYFRASINEYSPACIGEAIDYYRKCISVCPTLLATHYPIQQAATAAIKRLSPLSVTASSVEQGSPYRPLFKSRASSTSGTSLTSIASSACSTCGKEKRSMPVCAKCKSRVYCGLACLKADKENHAPMCSIGK
ncbi:hypothetical protein BDF14DRAFT_403192 [Spinellus fusiger]|nr:hypothetical protein BDF14DRAFT_403192 [Spinellus fusiger]